MDVGLRESQLAILTEAGELLDKRIRTELSRLVQFFGGRTRMKILLEASTESEWIARCLEELGHEVVVADPNYAPKSQRPAALTSVPFALPSGGTMAVTAGVPKGGGVYVGLRWHGR